MPISINKLYKACSLFYREAALEFGEEEQWIPEGFRQLQPFKDFSQNKVEKIFSQYGIDDFVVPLSSKEFNLDEHTKNIIKKIKNALLSLLGESKALEWPSLLRSGNLDRIKTIMFQLQEHVEKFPTAVRSVKAIGDYPTNTNLIKIYHDLIGELKKYLPKQEFNDLPNIRFEDFKDFTKNIYLVFSTKVSDLAGISSRGLESCQSLFDKGNPKQLDEHNKRLAGTILSKTIGVCYITTKSNYKGRGWKMLSRALIRIIMRASDNKPVIYIDKMYPEYEDQIETIMKRELQKRSKIPVLVTLPGDSYIDDEDENIPEEYTSYQDSPIESYKELLEKRISSKSSDRYIAAHYLKPKDLLNLIHDSDNSVRFMVARRLSQEDLIEMINDPGEKVRLEVAKRLPKDKLHLMVNEKENDSILAYIAQNIPFEDLDLFKGLKGNKFIDLIHRRREREGKDTSSFNEIF